MVNASPSIDFKACSARDQNTESGRYSFIDDQLPAWLIESVISTVPDSKPMTWSQAISAAERLVHTNGGSVINPKDLLGGDLSLLTENIRKLLGSGHPVLNTISSYYFNELGSHDPSEAVILPTQRRLAEITEMIHTASLLHDDVIDISMTRRNTPSVNAEFGNKMAILAGDFLLARASVALARLRDPRVVELLSTVISIYLIAISCRSSAVLGGCTDDVIESAYLYGRNLGLAFQALKLVHESNGVANTRFGSRILSRGDQCDIRFSKSGTNCSDPTHSNSHYRKK
ncbi:hypothetical protein BSLG_005993 [Batrachochytrium salamandrivorans]|nr:hypothetical protein BSLG_005993 [Batrachochytrium salamandrivorans]